MVSFIELVWEINEQIWVVALAFTKWMTEIINPLGIPIIIEIPSSQN
jgi:hypothetical protein